MDLRKRRLMMEMWREEREEEAADGHLRTEPGGVGLPPEGADFEALRAPPEARSAELRRSLKYVE